MMLKKTLAAAAIAVISALTFVPSAKAGFGDFNYTTAITAPASSPVTIDSVATLAFNPGSGANLPGVPGSDITPFNFRLTGTGTGTANVNVGVDFIVTITDKASMMTEKVEYVGTITGTVTASSTSVSSLLTLMTTSLTVLTNNVPAPVYYVVDVSGLLEPGANGTLTTSPGGIGLTVRAVPEPASMALLGMGSIGALGLIRRRRRPTV